MSTFPMAGRFGSLLTAAALIFVCSCSRKGPDAVSSPEPDSAERKAAADSERLQGVWACESLDTGDPKQKLPPDLRVEDFRIHIKGNRLGKGLANGPLQHLSFTLQAGATPKVMTVTFLGKDGLPYNDRGPGAKSKDPAPSREWLYKFDGDKLVLAVLDAAIFSPPCPPPADFVARPWTERSKRGREYF
ncbi:MAG: hypothetical protein K8T89_04900 [Planctomycetes bacterium]|nr:hypothetical protein [Planctomycetota bacterium]